MTLSPLEAEGGPITGPQPTPRPRPWAAAFTIVCAALLTLALPLAAPTLNAVGVAGIPLGYYFAAQGALVLVALLGLWLSGPWRDWSHRERLGAFAASFSATGSWLSAGVVLTIVGGLFVYGHDGLPLLLGLAAGLLVSLVFVAPALDRAGALHVDDLLARLTASTYAAAAAGLGMAAGLVMLLSIELEAFALAIAAAGAAPMLAPPMVIGLAAALAILLSFAPGRRLRATVIAMALLVTAAGIWFTVWALAGKAPGALIPQLAFGGALGDLTRVERSLLTEGLADPVSMPPFSRPFVQVSWINFACLTFSMLLGSSVLPHMLWRRKAAARPPGSAAGAPPGVFYPSRHKAAFGLVVAASVLSALPAAAIFAKLQLYRSVAAGITVDAQPDWMRDAAQAGYLRICPAVFAAVEPPGAATATADSPNAGMANEPCGDPGGRLRIVDLAINPATAVLMAPGLAGIEAPWPVVFAAIASLLTLLAAAATLRMATEAATGWLSIKTLNEAARGLAAPAPLMPRIVIAVLLAALAAAGVIILNESAVNRLYWAFSLLGASVFPMVLLAALMPRVHGGALALGGLTGLAVCLYYVIGTTSVFAPHFALYWSAISDAPPWLLEELEVLLKTCAAGGEASAEACEGAITHGRELANWFGIDGRAGAAIGAPVGLLTALFAAMLLPKTASGSAGH
ncbi:MAG: hypothetical protein KJ587_09045 [Alphaproteobacteria bacterium]|nr:hypothetical protein [Alphaproteobacteria bacterium]